MPAQTIEDLGKLVKAKHPGDYDDLSDADLGAKVKAKHPGDYDDFTDTPAAAKPAPGLLQRAVDATTIDVSQFRKNNPHLAPVALAIPDLLSGIGAGAISTGVGAYNLARKIPGMDKVLPAPSEAATALTQPPDSNMGHVGKFVEQGAEYIAPIGEVNAAVKGIQAARAARLAIAGAPTAGKLLPALARIGAEAGTAGATAAVQSGGDPDAALMAAGTTGVVGGAVAAIPPAAKAAIGRALIQGTRPLSEGAIALADRFRVPLNHGDLGGSKMIQGINKVLSATVAPDLYEAEAAKAQTGLNAGAQELSNGFVHDTHSAGQDTVDRMLASAKEHTADANAYHATLEGIEADPKNIKSVPTGKTTPQTASTLLGPDGRPAAGAPGAVPVMEDVGLPVNIKGTRSALDGWIDKLTTGVPAADQRLDPTLAVLNALKASPDYLPASKVNRLMGFLKETQRGDASPMSKFLAGKILDQLEPAIQATMKDAGPEAVEALNGARDSWAKRSNILETVQDLSTDVTGKTGQTAAAEKLLASADRNFPMLEKVLATAPEAKKALGDAFLTNKVFSKVAGGDDLRTAVQSRNLWNQLGKRTKEALYTPDQIRDVNDFLELTQRISENPNPSGTGYINGILKAVGLITHPIGGGAAIVAGRRAAQFLLNPERATLLRTAIEGGGTEAGANALAKLEEMDAAKPTAATEAAPQRQQPLQQQQSGPEAGPHGPIYTEFAGNPREALAHVRSQGTGIAEDAIPHESEGGIGLPWGFTGTPAKDFHDGFGVSHIDAAHPGWLDAHVDEIAKMPVVKRYFNQDGTVNGLVLSDGRHLVNVAKNWNGDPAKPWIVTGYDPLAPRTKFRVPGAPAGAGPTPPATNGPGPIVQESAPAGNTPPAAGSVVTMDPRDIKADPARFQYKRDTGGAAGVGEELKGVQKYDPELGGVLSVWHDPANGQTYVVNGHHRLELANRAQAPQVTVRYLDAANAAEARTKGAMINIAEGRGTPIDAAKVFRENHLSAADLDAKGISLKGEVAKQGQNLAQLSGSIFDRVIQGEIPVQRASLIGELLPNHADQHVAFEIMAKAEKSGKPLTNDAFREYVDFVRNGPKKAAAGAENMNLFGDEDLPDQSAALEMASLSDYIRKRMMTEKTLFSTVAQTRKAKMLAEAGNSMGDRNAEIASGAAQHLAAYDKLKAMSGPINDALRNGAESLGRRGAPANDIKNHAYERIRAAVAKIIGGSASE
jgi:hypothetical protein